MSILLGTIGLLLMLVQVRAMVYSKSRAPSLFLAGVFNLIFAGIAMVAAFAGLFVIFWIFRITASVLWVISTGGTYVTRLRERREQ